MGKVADPSNIEVIDPEIVRGEKEVIKMTPDQNNSPVYERGKKYTWDSNIKFELSGKEFGLWVNSIRQLLSTKEASNIMMTLECNSVIEDIMIREVASGKIIEVENIPKP